MGNRYWDDFIGAHWTPDEFREWVIVDNGMRDDDNQYDERRYITKIVEHTLGRHPFPKRVFWWEDEGHIDRLRETYADIPTEEIVREIMKEFE